MTTATKYSSLKGSSPDKNSEPEEKNDITSADIASKAVHETIESARSSLRYNVYAIAGGFISLSYGAYLVGHSGFGATSIICISLGVVVSAWMMRKNYLTDRDIGLTIERSVSLNEKGCILARLTDLPSWVSYFLFRPR